MTDDLKSSVSSDTDIEIRQNLVDTAVNFMLNRDVRLKPDSSKVTFLKNKGLNDAEISLAFEKVKVHPQYQSHINENPPHLPPLPYPQKTYSFWSQLGRISSSFIVLGVALYGLHHFYKLYIEPWLFGIKSEKSQLKQMEEQLHELNKSIQQLSSTVSTLEKSVNTHKLQIDSVVEASGIVSTSVSSIQKEMGNVKSLLINRHQFPAVPKVATPTIPIWQLESDAKKEAASDDENHSTALIADSELDSNQTSANTSKSNEVENGTPNALSSVTTDTPQQSESDVV